MKKNTIILALCLLSVSTFVAGQIDQEVPPEGETVKCRYTNIAADYCDNGYGGSRYYCVNTTAEQTCKFY